MKISVESFYIEVYIIKILRSLSKTNEETPITSVVIINAINITKQKTQIPEKSEIHAFLPFCPMDSVHRDNYELFSFSSHLMKFIPL